jgi:hypothetical protein
MAAISDPAVIFPNVPGYSIEFVDKSDRGEGFSTEVFDAQEIEKTGGEHPFARIYITDYNSPESVVFNSFGGLYRYVDLGNKGRNVYKETGNGPQSTLEVSVGSRLDNDRKMQIAQNLAQIIFVLNKEK